LALSAQQTIPDFEPGLPVDFCLNYQKHASA
jgi:hypothetical protein